MAPVDPYTVLGVARGASSGELRRAYRLLALRHHPDRAGEGSTEVFQRIADAYRLLSDPEARAAYEHSPFASASRDRDGGQTQTQEHFGAGGRVTWRTQAKTRAPRGQLLDRLCGTLEALVARAAARRVDDGVVELLLIPEETARGGAASIDLSVTVTCPTCYGLASPDEVWCRRCDHAGTVTDNVAVVVEIAPGAPDGTTFTFAVDPVGREAPVRVRLRRA